MPVLYVVGTPIGNLEDVSIRALRVLGEVSLIAAEDTRTTRKLLARHGIRTPLTSFHAHTTEQKVASLLEALEHGDVALASEAGTPGVSDPGAALVVAAAARGIRVVAVPGPSAATAAVAISGMSGDRFLFLGFLPRRRKPRLALLESVAHESRTLVVFEAPHRLRAALQDMVVALGNRRLAACREMTKLHEEVFRGSLEEALDHFSAPRGEFTLVVEGAATAPRSDAAGVEEARAALRRLQCQGKGAKESVAEVAAASGLPRRQVYRLWLEVSRQEGSPRRRADRGPSGDGARG